MDRDGDQVIQKQEYIFKYLECQKQLEEKKVAMQMQIINHNDQRIVVSRTLEQTKMTEPQHMNISTGIRKDA